MWNDQCKKGTSMIEYRELVSPSLKDLFVKEITEQIWSGKLSVGERLPNERELAEKMHVSRAVINGGITELANKGFLEVVPRKGTFVADYKRTGTLDTLTTLLEYNGNRFDPILLNSLLEVRLCMEVNFVARAASNRSEEDLNELRTCYAKLQLAKTAEEHGMFAFEFYHILSLASGNIVHPLILYGFKTIYSKQAGVLFKRDKGKERVTVLRELLHHIEKQNPEAAAECAVRLVELDKNVLGNEGNIG